VPRAKVTDGPVAGLVTIVKVGVAGTDVRKEAIETLRAGVGVLLPAGPQSKISVPESTVGVLSSTSAPVPLVPGLQALVIVIAGVDGIVTAGNVCVKSKAAYTTPTSDDMAMMLAKRVFLAIFIELARPIYL